LVDPYVRGRVQVEDGGGEGGVHREQRIGGAGGEVADGQPDSAREGERVVEGGEGEGERLVVVERVRRHGLFDGGDGRQRDPVPVGEGEIETKRPDVVRRGIEEEGRATVQRVERSGEDRIQVVVVSAAVLRQRFAEQAAGPSSRPCRVEPPR